MNVAVGSKNPAKLKAVKLAFKKVFLDAKIHIFGVSITSVVSNQPMSDEESIIGATHRAKQSIAKMNADYGVGLEGGLHTIAGRWFDSGWCVIVDRDGHEGIGDSIKMQTPIKLMNHIFAGKELGQANDIVFQTSNSKQKYGHFGLMTKNAITRTGGYRDAVIAALSRFIHPSLFEK